MDEAGVRFQHFSARKTQEAIGAAIRPLAAVDEGPIAHELHAIGNEWSRRFFGGDVYLFDPPADRPAISLVFVQSREGNTVARNPDDLGGGPTDKHLIYEGVSRVAADAVLAGAATASGRSVFFSVWHPQLVRLRQDLGLSRHPAQIVMSREGNLDLNRTLLFNVPDVPVFVVAGDPCGLRCRADFSRRPWVTVVPIEPEGLRAALARLRLDHGIRRISAVGGRSAATTLIDAALVQDLWLTTTARSAGEPNTPFYAGHRPPSCELIVRKQELATDEAIRVEHLALHYTSVAWSGPAVSESV
jgi:riboflavin biosynthesis pyrimidine reductase